MAELHDQLQLWSSLQFSTTYNHFTLDILGTAFCLISSQEVVFEPLTVRVNQQTAVEGGKGKYVSCLQGLVM